MLEVTLAEYTSHLFQEVVRARQLSDLHSKSVAEAYALDEVLRHFPVPRFRIPKVTLTIPVVIERATFKALKVRDLDEISAMVGERLKEMLGEVEKRHQVFGFRPIGPNDSSVINAFVARMAAEHGSVDAVVDCQQLARSFLQPDPSIAKKRFDLEDIDLRIASDAGILIARSIQDALRVNRAGIESLFVNPITSAVKDGGQASVFTLTAELVEEGFFLRTIRDDETGARRTIVEFD
jgi:hypothetical protein